MRNAKVEDKAEKYVEARDKRMKLTEKEVAAKQELIAAMTEAKLDHYRCQDADLYVELTEQQKVKVKRVKDDNAGDGDD